jgi:hypothetical protein
MCLFEGNMSCHSCAFGTGPCEGGLCGQMAIHVCPEPFDHATAERMARMFSSSGAPPVSPTIKAKIVLGLKGPQG